jgi:hypothetical protein
MKFYLQRLAKKYSDITVVKVDVDKCEVSVL